MDVFQAKPQTHCTSDSLCDVMGNLRKIILDLQNSYSYLNTISRWLKVPWTCRWKHLLYVHSSYHFSYVPKRWSCFDAKSAREKMKDLLEVVDWNLIVCHCLQSCNNVGPKTWQRRRPFSNSSMKRQITFTWNTQGQRS